MKLALRDYQKKDVDTMIELKKCINANDMGL